MRKISMLLAAAGMAIAAPAMAAFQVTIGAPVSPTAGVGNDFQAQLGALGLTKMTADMASIFLSADSTITVDYMASESGFNNTFSAGGNSFTEFGNKGWGAVFQFTFDRTAGAVGNNDWTFSSSGNPNGPFGIGTNAFGIFYNPDLVVNGVYTSDVLYFGLDDQPGQADDNHDDIIVRLTAVTNVTPGGIPEPTSWAMLIAGFGLVGAAQRRRKGLTVAA